MRVLFITANRIGDAILSTGLLRHVVDAYPDAQITVACGSLCVDLFRAVPGLERVIPLQKASWNRHWLGLWQRCLPAYWDIIIDLRNTAISRLLLHGQRYGYSRGDDTQHKVVQNAAIMRLAVPPDPKIWVSEADQDEARTLFGQAPVIALGPSANWFPKQWPPEHFAALVQDFCADADMAAYRFLLLAAEHERAQLTPVLEALPPERRITLIGSSLALAAACLERAELFIGNDSGLMHLAAAVGTPTLGLFGPGYEKIYGPWGDHTAYLRTPESAAELLKLLPHPGAHEPNLMKTLTVERVAAEARRLLKNRKHSSLRT
jgi:heptosyltransferase III